jgi:hypothetical protein
MPIRVGSFDMKTKAWPGLSLRLNHFIMNHGSIPDAIKKHPWVGSAWKDYMSRIRAYAEYVKVMNHWLLLEEIRRCGLKAPLKNYALHRRGIVQKFKPVKNIPIPKNSR